MAIKRNLQPWGDSIDTVKYSKPLDNWYTEHKELPYNFFKLPETYAFDLVEMREHVTALLNQQDTISITKNKSGDKFNRYRGLGFYSRADVDNPLEDHFTRRDESLGVVYPDDLHLNVQLPALIENDFTQPTGILDEYFNSVFGVFKSKISKASILDLRPLGWLGSHVDFPYYKTIRLHASIFGNENAWYEVCGEKFQLPADGNWYFIDTGKYHSIWNEGPENRVTLNINLCVSGDPQELAQSNSL
jgi:Aspartyl/Asparaginyl beta-hydroxylase